MEIIRLESIDSTNRYCELLDLPKAEEFTIVCADEQTAGRGQQSHHWESQPGKNLTFSIILHPTFLGIVDQFQLHKVLSLGLTDLLKSLDIEQVSIKWPNDIYVADRKICGILVANKINQNTLQSSICGIGLNVNQRLFPDWVPNATSISIIKGNDSNTDEILEKTLYYIKSRYQMLLENKGEKLNEDYLSQLMNYKKSATYLYKGETLCATITGVNRYGHLQLTTEKKEEISCQMGEISLIH